MVTYTYRCAAHGPVDVRRPIGTAPATITCPACSETSTRVIAAPMLALADQARTAMIDRAEASRTEPAVVSAIPPAPRAGRRGRAPGAAVDPRTRTLPRP